MGQNLVIGLEGGEVFHIRHREGIVKTGRGQFAGWNIVDSLPVVAGRPNGPENVVSLDVKGGDRTGKGIRVNLEDPVHPRALGGRARLVDIGDNIILRLESVLVGFGPVGTVVGPIVDDIVPVVHLAIAPGCVIIVAGPVEPGQATAVMGHQVVVESGVLSAPDAAVAVGTLAVKGVVQGLGRNTPLHGEVLVVVGRSGFVDTP